MRMVLPNHTSTRLMNELASDVGTLFDTFFGERSGQHGTERDARLLVPMDVEEGENAYTVRLDVPGVDLDAIEIDVHEDQLRISGHRGSRLSDVSEATDASQSEFRDDSESVVEDTPDSEREALRTQVLRSERRQGRFERRVQFPKSVEADRVDADLADGVLTIRLPKSDPEKGKRRVSIRKG